jgi:2-isopropylmalate synthase
MILKKLLSDRYTVGISETKLTELTAVSRIVDEVLGRTPYAQAPYVGVDAFATKAGIHASAILKEPATYEHVEPSKVGNQRRIFVASQAGRSNVLAALDRLGIDVNADDDKVSQVVENVKRAEAHGVAYDLAQATLDLEILETFGRRKTRGLELVEIASRQVPAKQWSHLSVQARSHDSTAPAQIETEGADLFDLATQAVLGFYPSYASVVRSLDLTLISLRFVSTGSEHLWRAIVEGKDKGLSQPWRTLAIGQSVIEVYLKAVDSCCCYRIESVQ